MELYDLINELIKKQQKHCKTMHKNYERLYYENNNPI